MEHPPQEPKPPAGLHGPAAEGAQNVLSPAVRGELRAVLREAIWGAVQDIIGDLAQRMGQRMGGQALPGVPPGAALPLPSAGEPLPASLPPVAAGSGPPPPATSGPFPHGDLDLRFIPANVPGAEARAPKRGNARQYYFLPQPAAPQPGAPTAQPAQPTAPTRQPGGG